MHHIFDSNFRWSKNMVAKSDRVKGKIGVLIEDHFDDFEFRAFNQFFPDNGYEVEYISHLWSQKQIKFTGNESTEEVTVTIEVNDVKPQDYDGIILIGAYAMDRLRYEANPQPGQPNQSPAVEFLRQAVALMDRGRLKIGTICHSLWLFCAAHNLIYDVQNAGGILVFDDNGTEIVYVDGGLITAKHPEVVDRFLEVFLSAIEEQQLNKVAT
jgi:protease I